MNGPATWAACCWAASCPFQLLPRHTSSTATLAGAQQRARKRNLSVRLFINVGIFSNVDDFLRYAKGKVLDFEVFLNVLCTNLSSNIIKFR